MKVLILVLFLLVAGTNGQTPKPVFNTNEFKITGDLHVFDFDSLAGVNPIGFSFCGKSGSNYNCKTPVRVSSAPTNGEWTTTTGGVYDLASFDSSLVNKKTEQANSLFRCIGLKSSGSVGDPMYVYFVISTMQDLEMQSVSFDVYNLWDDPQRSSDISFDISTDPDFTAGSTSKTCTGVNLAGGSLAAQVVSNQLTFSSATGCDIYSLINKNAGKAYLRITVQGGNQSGQTRKMVGIDNFTIKSAKAAATVSTKTITLNFDSTGLQNGDKIQQTYLISSGVTFDDKALYSTKSGKGMATKTSTVMTVSGGFSTPFKSSVTSLAKRGDIATISVYKKSVNKRGDQLLVTQGVTGSGPVQMTFLGTGDYVVFTTNSDSVVFDDISFEIPSTTTYSGAATSNQCTPDTSVAPTHCSANDKKGKCVGGFCSCFSGFKGDQCASDSWATGTFTPEAVSVNADDYEAKLAISFDEGDVTFKVTTPSSQTEGNVSPAGGSYSTATLLSFLGGSQARKRELSDCDYPKDNGWVLSSDEVNSRWMDSYSQKFSYSELKNCGLVSTGSASGFHIFNDTLLIERDYVIKKGTFQLPRTNLVEQKFAIEFPTTIIAKQSVVVQDFDGFFGTWSSVKYDHATAMWKLTLVTLVESPFYVTFLSAADPFPNGNDRAFTSPSVGSPTEPSCPTGDCTQKFEFSLKSCKKVDFAGLAIKFNLLCRSGQTCTESKVSATVGLTTTSACPVNSDFTSTQMSITTINDPSTAPSGGVYGSSQNINFLVDFNIPSAFITSVTVTKVCAYTGPDKDVCPEGDTNKVSFTKIEGNALGTKKAGYTVNAGELKTAAGVSDTSPFKVHADLTVSYSDLTKRSDSENMIAKSGTVSIRVSNDQEDDAIIEKEELSLPSSASSLSLVFVLLTITFLASL